MAQTTTNDIRSDKKKKGIFYTPADATKILCDWAIKSPEDNILEPSFGGCGFLTASLDRLTELQCIDPINRIFGSDIDPEAFKFLQNILPVKHDYSDQFIQRDFLSLEPNNFAINSFDVIIGNPPYIAHHNMSPEQKTNAWSAITRMDLKLSLRASLWSFFIFHSLNFLKIGGRAAWILPSSLLHADYANDIYKFLQTYFERSILFVLEERLFLNEGTEERTVVLLCDQRKNDDSVGELKTGFARDLAALQQIIENWDEHLWQGQDLHERTNIALIQGKSLTAFQEICDLTNVISFDSVAKIKIGIVTGANNFFIINQKIASEASLPEESLQFILAKLKDFPGIKLVNNDFIKAREDGKKCLLIDTSLVNNIPRELQLYLDSYPEDERSKVKTFKKRSIWHQANDNYIPDAFFPYMQQNGPFLILNNARVNSTNTIHRVYFKENVDSTLQKIIAISILSTFSQLSAEMEGRSYGSGVLKFEVAEVGRIKLIVPPNLERPYVNKIFNKINQLRRANNFNQAQDIADDFVLQSITPGTRTEYLQELKLTLASLRSMRKSS